MSHLKDLYDIAFDTGCMHEFVMTLENLKKEKGVTAMEYRQGAVGQWHPPTDNVLPADCGGGADGGTDRNETRETLDHAIEVFRSIYIQAQEHPEQMHELPLHTPVRRLDEVGAARNPRLRYTF